MKYFGTKGRYIYSSYPGTLKLTIEEDIFRCLASDGFRDISYTNTSTYAITQKKKSWFRKFYRPDQNK